MRETAVAVQCEFDPEGKTVPELLEESFALYLRRILADAGPDAAQFPR